MEAYLADGACVAAWCRASLASTRALVEGAAAAPASAPAAATPGVAAAAAEGLATARTRLAALVPLSEALSRGGSSSSGDSAGPEAAAAAGGGMNDGDDDETRDGGDGGPSSSSPASTAAEAKKLAQCADVLDWCLSERSAAADSLRGRCASEAEWRVAVSRRRAAVSGGRGGNGGVRISSTFLDALRARAAGSCSSSSNSVVVEYPPAPTPRAAAPAIFLSRGASPAALSAKLDLFAYCLADAGEESSVFFFPCADKKTKMFELLTRLFTLFSSKKKNTNKTGGAASLPSLGARFGSSSAAVARWRLAQLLDEALALSSSSSSGEPLASSSSSADSSSVLDAAVRAVPAATSPDAPYELAKALVALGRPEAALALLRARTKSSFSSSSSSSASASANNRNSSTSSSFETRLDEALTGLAARLECGLLSEAFTEARAAAARAAPVGSGEHAAAVRALAAALARWAADNGELPSVALFPLSGLEERALLEWLESEEEEGANGRGDAALQTVLFHLQRGRAPEALLAAARAEGGRLVKPTSGGAARNAAEAGALELLRQAARSLPAAQRALLLVKAAPGGTAAGGGGSAAALSSLLRLAGPGEPAPEGSLRLVAEGLADVPAARLLSAGSIGVSTGGGRGARAPPPPLLLSLTSEAWMERKGAVGSGGGVAAEENARGGEEDEPEGGEQQRRTTVQKPPSALRPPPPRTRAASSVVAAAAGWDRRAGGGASAAAGAATPAGFLAPVAVLGTATTAKKKARLQAVRL